MRLLTCSLACLAALSLTLGAPALANDTALHPGAHGPEPVGGVVGAESVIRMVEEHIDIRFGRELTTVAVRFVFRNTMKQGTAKQLLGFPDIAAAQAESIRRDPKGEARWFYPMSDVTGPMRDVETLVNDWPVETKRQFGFVQEAPNSLGWKAGTPQNGHMMAWHVASVEFPAGKEVTVERRYQVQNGQQVSGVSFFEYVTYTGRIWQGKIGKLVADVTLADGLKVDDLVWKGRPLPKGVASFSDGFATSPDRSHWQVISPTRLRLTWKDFEPIVGGDRAGLFLSAPAKR